MGDVRAGDDPWAVVEVLAPGTLVEVRSSAGPTYRGTLVPRNELAGPRVLVLKLASGYNVGVHVAVTDQVVVLEAAPPMNHNGVRAGPAPQPPGEWVAILTTGGTIASRVDYRTGGVRPVRDEAEILTFYPHLDRDGPVRIVPVFDRLSEEIQPADWSVLADRVAKVFADGAHGVVVAHGTDTLAYTAAALAFALGPLPGPVVVVGAQRSPDRPSSDGDSNLGAAMRVARHPDLGEVVVVMHAGLSDTEFAVHRGSRVRKMHSSRRDAFLSRNSRPLGKVVDGVVELSAEYRRRVASPLRPDVRVDERGALLWSYPGLAPERAEAFVEGMRGVVVAGTGLGHVSSVHLPWIRRAVDRGVVVAMTSQCLEGSVDPYVYATGRELARAGVTYLGDLLPETAYVKLLFALGRCTTPEEVRSFLLEDRAGEFEPRHRAEALP